MTNRTASEYPHAINGVKGRMLPAHVWPVGDLKIAERAQGRLSSQTWVSQGRPAPSYGPGCTMRVNIRFDDNCKNGRESFAITCDVFERGRDVGGGAAHEEIAAAFPELADLIPWHLCDTAGPMHYIANALYLAGDADHSGRRAGEVSSSETVLRFGDNPIKHRIPRGLEAFLREIGDYDPDGKAAALVPIAVAYDGQRTYSTTFAPKYQFAGQPPRKWHECAFDTQEEAERFAAAFLDHSPVFDTLATRWSDGKARELDAARSVAIWPEATDEELSAPRDVLKAALEARQPALVARFRAAVDACGFAWDASELEA